ncbi:MAG: GtrA family protein [Thermoplasmata archaeon]
MESARMTGRSVAAYQQYSLLSDKNLIVISDYEEIPKNIPQFGSIKVFTKHAIEKDPEKFRKTLSDDTYYVICDGYISKNMFIDEESIFDYDIILEKRQLSGILKLIKKFMMDGSEAGEISLDTVLVNSRTMEYILQKGYKINGETVLKIISRRGFTVKYVDTNIWQKLSSFVYAFFFELWRSPLLKYLIVGASGIIINELLLKGLSVYTNMILADAIAIETSIMSNFSMNEYWTFRSRKISRNASSILKRAGLHNFTSLVGMGINLGIFTVLAMTGMDILIANLIGIVIAFGARYIMSSKIIWKNHSSKQIIYN